MPEISADLVGKFLVALTKDTDSELNEKLPAILIWLAEMLLESSQSSICLKLRKRFELFGKGCVGALQCVVKSVPTE